MTDGGMTEARPSAGGLREDVLAGGGEMGALMRAHDWGATSLGPVEHWPRSLKTAIRIMLTSRQPIWIGWGPDLVFFYNDPYQSIIGGKHPWALGRPTAEVWQEIWSDIGPMLATAMGGIEGTYVKEQLLIMERNDYPEETYYTFSYSPIPDDDGNPAGIICANTDDTQRVVGQRQLTLLRELAAGTANILDWQEICRRATAALAADPHDLPFALIYMAEPGADTLALVATAGMPDGHAAAPASVSPGQPTLWPFDRVLRTQEICLVPDLTGFGETLPTGAWSAPPDRAVLLPITPAGETARAGILVAGLNPYRLFDNDYRSFLSLATGQISAAIANADAYAQERHRAEALAELDRTKTTFFSNISHEFRTPLTLMLGPIEDSLADAGRLPAAERDRAEIVHRNALRLLKLVNSLLDFSRIEAGRTHARFEPTELAGFTAELASNFRSAMEKAGLTLRVDCRPLAEPAHVDRDMWEKIVLNLLSNAFKFTFEGTISITLAEVQGVARLVVRDTGTGIPAHELPRLFERFQRIAGARGRSFEGSGIGLALVQELVKLHGGTIGVESAEGHGTAFTIDIPLGTAHLPRDHRPDDTSGMAPWPTPRVQAFVAEALRWLPDAPAGDDVEPAFAMPISDSAGPAGGKRAFVLIADDNADMRRYVSRLLDGSHDCETVPDGEAALAVIRQRRPDLLLTDVMMPRLDGFGLLQAVRADPDLRDLPVIILSARAGEEASVEGLSAGADGYLAKPFSARELIARVDGALALARIRRQMAAALREEAQSLEILNRVGAAVAAELDLDRAVQVVTDSATELTGAAFGAFFYNMVNAAGESYLLYSLSGAPREAFDKFPMPRNTAVFAPTFSGAATVRSDDITADPRYGRSEPYFGMPKGHLPVRSYLATPVISRSGEVLGGLFFGHPEPGVFTERDERLLAGISAQASIAIDNARLYQAAQTEIAERRKTEAALREAEERQVRLNQTLEIKVAERTAELEAANDRLRAEAAEREHIEQVLRQAQKMEAVGKLTGGVAHDFNNLLQVIGGNLQLLSKDVTGSEKAEQRLRNALAGVSRGSKLAAQLLAFGRRQPLAPKVVNLGRFVRGLDDLLRRALGDGIEIETVISGGLWNTLVDPTQVENALLNLAINARDAMTGHGKLTVEAGNALLDDTYVARHADVSPGQYVMLAVTDTGCGMTPEVMEHVFEPFFTTKPEGQGTGLGLSMVYGFVKQSDGHIKIYSEPGQGTTIRMYLPRVRDAEDMTTEVDSAPVTGGTETVLVVEDDEDVRGTVVELLSDLGYRVLKAKDAQSALAIIESGVPIDLLFTDVVMPGTLRSPELARKARERLPEIAVLFTSGYTDNAIVHGGRLDEGIELLSKPYTREALARKIRHVLRNQQQQNAALARISLAPGPAPETEEPAPGGGLTVLLVEDDGLIRFATADMLAVLGHTALEAGNATEALDILAQQPVDVLLTDLGLPGISGRDLAIQALKRLPDLRVVFASGQNALPDGPDAALLAKAVLLPKPYDTARLEEALDAAMG
jgi:signal transduction histidine kinase/CheY-like chemotaxis protein